MTSDSDTLATRLQRLEDLEEIRQIFVDYGHYLDHGDFASYGALFADEGEILLGPIGRAKGPAAIQALMEKTLTGSRSSFHLVTNPRVVLDGDSATSEVMWTVVVTAPDGSLSVSMLGRHVDTLVRERGRWKFLRREGHIDVPKRYPGGTEKR